MTGIFFLVLLVGAGSAALYIWARVKYQEQTRQWTASILGSPLLRLGVVGGIILISQIPMLFVEGVLDDRQYYASQVTNDLADESGGAQVFSGPYLVVPYLYDTTRNVTRKIEDGTFETRPETVERKDVAIFLPENLTVQATLDPVEKQRSIYRTLAYNAQLSASGTFAPLDFQVFERENLRLDPGKAYISFGLTNMATVSGTPGLRVGDQTEFAIQPSGNFRPTGVHALIDLDQSALSASTAFDIALEFTGHRELRAAPLGQNNSIQIDSPWPHPSFQGLSPNVRSIDDDGFKATWTTSALARDYPQIFAPKPETTTKTTNLTVGAALFDRFGTYGQIDRAIKYSLLIIGLTFLALLVIDQSASRRMHALQYLVVGGGMSLFYLLLLSLSEVIGFPLAFAIAAAALSISIGGYVASALGSIARGAIVLLTLAGLYGLLYTLLNLQDLALLVGSGLLFVAMLIIMMVTRNMARPKVPQS